MNHFSIESYVWHLTYLGREKNFFGGKTNGIYLSKVNVDGYRNGHGYEQELQGGIYLL